MILECVSFAEKRYYIPGFIMFYNVMFFSTIEEACMILNYIMYVFSSEV